MNIQLQQLFALVGYFLHCRRSLTAPPKKEIKRIRCKRVNPAEQQQKISGMSIPA